jgi:hypothetical protein
MPHCEGADHCPEVGHSVQAHGDLAQFRSSYMTKPKIKVHALLGMAVPRAGNALLAYALHRHTTLEIARCCEVFSANGNTQIFAYAGPVSSEDCGVDSARACSFCTEMQSDMALF